MCGATLHTIACLLWKLLSISRNEVAHNEGCDWCVTCLILLLVCNVNMMLLIFYFTGCNWQHAVIQGTHPTATHQHRCVYIIMCHLFTENKGFMLKKTWPNQANKSRLISRQAHTYSLILLKCAVHSLLILPLSFAYVSSYYNIIIFGAQEEY